MNDVATLLKIAKKKETNKDENLILTEALRAI